MIYGYVRGSWANNIQKLCHFYNSYVSLQLFENKRFIKKEGAGRRIRKQWGLGTGNSAVNAQVQGLLRLSSLEIRCPTVGSFGTRKGRANLFTYTSARRLPSHSLSSGLVAKATLASQCQKPVPWTQARRH